MTVLRWAVEENDANAPTAYCDCVLIFSSRVSAGCLPPCALHCNQNTTPSWGLTRGKQTIKMQAFFFGGGQNGSLLDWTHGTTRLFQVSLPIFPARD